MSPTARQARELAARESDGINVVLLWHPDENALTVSVESAVGQDFEIAFEVVDDLPAWGLPARAPGTRGSTAATSPSAPRPPDDAGVVCAACSSWRRSGGST